MRKLQQQSIHGIKKMRLKLKAYFQFRDYCCLTNKYIDETAPWGLAKDKFK